jgi:hypothetical protein
MSNQDMSKCTIAYCFKTSRDLYKFLESQKHFEPSNFFLAQIKPRKNKKGEYNQPYNGSKVALCKIVNDEVLAGGMKYCETTLDVATSSKGMEHFYASQRVKGEDIQQWVEEAMEIDEDDFPELPEYKKPLTKAQVEQRKYAGAGKATQGMVDKLEKMLEEKDKEIAEYKKHEEEDVKIDERAEEIIDLKEKIEKLESDLEWKDHTHKEEMKDLQDIVDTQKELIDEMKDYDLYKAFFERFSKAPKAKEWIAEYQA